MSEPDAIKEFRCLKCGNCCRGEGYVRITSAEVAAIACHLGMTIEAFVARYAQAPWIPEHAQAGDFWLVDKAGADPECVFLEQNRCLIEPVKPRHCRDFPMRWRTPNVHDYCVGMRSQ